MIRAHQEQQNTCVTGDVICGPGDDSSQLAAELALDKAIAAYTTESEPEDPKLAYEDLDAKLMETHAQVQGHGQVQVPPIAALAVGTFAGDLTAARNIVRPVAKAAAAESPIFVVPPMGAHSFAYAFDIRRRVTRATGFVLLRKRTRIPNYVAQYCDAAYAHTPGAPRGAVDPPGNRNRRNWHSGHIIAARLGGSNTDPTNFFPQHSKSNSGGGIWWRLEMIIGYAQIEMNARGFQSAPGEPCQIRISPAFVYAPDAGGVFSWMPTSGTYTVEVLQACVHSFGAIPGPNPAITGLAKVFWKWSQAGFRVAHAQPNVFGPGSGPGYRYTFNWINQANKPDPANLAHGVYFFP